jgi:hypothetical protein
MNKLLLALSKILFKIDLHVIHGPGGTVAARADSNVSRYEHDRLDALLNIPAEGTGLALVGHRVMIFRPAAYRAGKSAPDFIWGPKSIFILAIR